jgi:hypothetical protein
MLSYDRFDFSESSAPRRLCRINIKQFIKNLFSKSYYMNSQELLEAAMDLAMSITQGQTSSLKIEQDDDMIVVSINHPSYDNKLGQGKNIDEALKDFIDIND